MYGGLLKWIFLLTVSSNQAQDPRRGLLFNQHELISSPLEEGMGRLGDEHHRIVACSEHHCFLKRSLEGQDEMGPFWANRGKKDPTYRQESLYAEEPYWVLVRRDERFQEEDPFFISRGKKLAEPSFNLRLRERRKSSLQDVDAPFFAARGKRTEQADD